MICRFCHHVRTLSPCLISESPVMRVFSDTCSHCGAEYRTTEKVEHLPRVDAEGLEKIANVHR